MNVAEAKQILTEKEPARLYDVVEPVLKNAELREALVENSFAKDETTRYNSVRVLFRALARQPALFYSHWDLFAKMIDSPNGFHRSAAAQAIAFLAATDFDCRLDKIFRHYLGLLDDPKVMVSHYFIETLDRVYRARPDLQSRITDTLFGIDRTRHLPERRELLKADILGVLDRLFEMLPNKDRRRAEALARAALQSTSGKTRKAAKIFLSQHFGSAESAHGGV